MASGAKGGSADPTWQPNGLSLGGKLDPILLKAVDDVSIQGDGRNRPQALYKGPPTTLSLTHHLEVSLSTLSYVVLLRVVELG